MCERQQETRSPSGRDLSERDSSEDFKRLCCKAEDLGVLREVLEGGQTSGPKNVKASDLKEVEGQENSCDTGTAGAVTKTSLCRTMDRH